MKETLLLEIHNAVAIITINDAPYNRMSLEFMDVLEETCLLYTSPSPRDS